MPRRPTVPAYCLHKPTGQAYVRLSGQTIYLGKYDSPESKARYRQLLAEYPTPESRKSFIPKSEADTKPTVAELCARYWLFAKDYYSADELGVIRAATRPLVALYAALPAEQFGAIAMKAVRSYIIQQGDQRRGKKRSAEISVEQPEKRKPISRSYVNRLAGYIKRIFKWSVANELIPVTTYQTLLTIDGLRKGRTPDLKETKRVKPVAMATVEQTLPYLQPGLAAVVRLQLLTGARPDEITIIRPCDLNMEHELWEYRPTQHKTKWREGNDDKVILMGAQAQAVLASFLAQCELPTDYVFSPRRVVARINIAKRGSGRFIKRNYIPRPIPIGRATEHYTDESYRRAVIRACDTAGIERWTPNQLRHTRATEVANRFGVEAASLMLRHKNLETTLIYAERDEKNIGKWFRKPVKSRLPISKNRLPWRRS
jgi:integrase